MARHINQAVVEPLLLMPPKAPQAEPCHSPGSAALMDGILRPHEEGR